MPAKLVSRGRSRPTAGETPALQNQREAAATARLRAAMASASTTKILTSEEVSYIAFDPR